MLKFIIGRSGSGKSEYIMDMLSSLSENADKKLFLIIPEQSSFYYERSLLERLTPMQARRIEVVSFSRLSEYVMRITGGFSGRRITNSEKYLIMAQALENTADKLELYADKALSQELTALMLKTAERLKLCCVSSEALRQAAFKVSDEILSKKLKDTSLIIDAYNAIIDRNYIDPSDDLTRLYNILFENDIFKDSIVFIDSFSGFTEKERRIIERIIASCDDCYVSLCMDDVNNTSDVFKLTKSTYLQLLHTAQSGGVKVSEHYVSKQSYRYLNDELKVIERNILSNRMQTYSEKAEHTEIFCACDIYRECDYIARRIRELVSKENYRFRDIAVISRSISPYKGVLDAAFKDYGIAYFMDEAFEVDSTALMRLVISALDIALGSYNTEYILKYLKSGLTSISNREISLLENYILMWNIKGSDMKKPFVANVNGFGREPDEKSEKKLSELNCIREKIMDALIPFAQSIKQASAKEISRAIYTLINKAGTKEELKKLIKSLKASGDINNARKQERLWEILMQTLDYMAFVTDDKVMSVKRYKELFSSIISDADMSVIPQGSDTVTVGSADRIRTHSPKVVFIAGAAEGQFPMPQKLDGLFSPTECDLLSMLDIKLYDDIESINAMETFFAYFAVSSPREKLYVSWSQNNKDVSDAKPSVIVTDIMKILPKITVLYESDFSHEECLWAKKPAFEQLALSDVHGRVSVTLHSYFETEPNYKDKLKAIDAIRLKLPFELKDRENTLKLLHNDMELSPTKIEKYHLCRFAYFCSYALSARERKKAELNYMEYGSLVHSVLENFFIKNKGRGIGNISKNEIKEQVRILTEEYISRYMGGSQDKSSGFRYICNRLCESLELLVAQLSSEFAQSKFTPDALEMSISSTGDVQPYKIQLPSGGSVNIIGKIDRVDTFEHDGKTYIRVVDYKTGSKEFIAADVVHGLNMQMLLYLSVLSRGENSKYNCPAPAGVLYMPSVIKNVTVLPNTTEQESEKLIADSLCMNGLLIDDIQVLRAMEEDLSGRYIPVALKSMDDDIPVYKSESSLTTPEGMAGIFKYIDSLIIDMAEDLRSGKIDNIPAKGAYDACAYCSFRSVCGFEDGDKVRYLRKGKKGEVPAVLTGEEESKNVGKMD